MSEIKKLDLRSMDIIREQKEKLRQLFPEIFTEDKIDFEKLKADSPNISHGYLPFLRELLNRLKDDGIK